jgi:Glu-tRNA(Gln) amidotransferase subunit E-like FAD-binding protein
MMEEKEPIKTIMRKQHPTQSEIGEVDATAQYEFLRNRTFNYQIFSKEDCLVECDEEPVHSLNKEALEIAMQIALMFNCTIPDEIQIMRKIVIDGSNTSAFQRTAIVGLDGYLEYKGKKIEITNVCLEEDAASIVDEKNGIVTYRLNRIGIPLVEIGTGVLIGYSPEEVQEVAYIIGMICRSTGKVKRGIGSIRQDVNVSVKNGARVEIKGIQKLGLLSKVIELEVQRQLSLSEVKEETRTANPDGTTRFTRPLPGSARMYVETDIPSILIDVKTIKKIKKNLPEPLTKKITRFKEKLKLSDELTKQILGSDYLELFENIIKKFNVNPSIVANVFVNTLKDLKKREVVPVENLTDEDFEKLFELIEKEKIVKESIPNLLSYKAKSPKMPIVDCIKKMGLETISEKELREIVKDVINMNKDKPMEKIIGIVMSKVRGRVRSEDAIKIVKEEYG